MLDQLVEEFTERVRAGDTPSISEYQERHPAWKNEIHELLSSVAMIEGLKKQTGSLSGRSGRAFEELLQLESLGEYRLIRELGRGGMGIVMEAVHSSLGRRVAIKVLPHRLVNNASNVERFTREARAAATLHHNNIVSVFGVGECHGYYYYVMEYIDGCGLDQVMRSMRAFTQRAPNATLIDQAAFATNPDTAATLPGGSASTDFQLSHTNHVLPAEQSRSLPEGTDRFEWAARIVADIADALEYAHQHGVLHRDIKPGNLLLDPSGRVWLTDFGLVKSITNQTMTMAGDIIGTPQYMAPESFEARYDIASETWCLGATLYELVTLKPVFEQGSAAQMVRRITTTTPVKPRKVDPRVPRDLAIIIEKSISREPRDRYQTAAALRDDLLAYLNDRPIQARPAAVSRRVWLWSKRNPWQAISALLVGLVAVVATAGFISRSRSLDDTRVAKEKAEENLAKYREQYERAEANVDLSLEMFDEMFKQMVLRGTGQQKGFSFDGFQELSGIETTVSRDDAEYLENMLVFVQRFARENSGNTELAAESAKSFRRVGNIYHLLGKPEDARTAYRKSIKLYDELLQLAPTDAIVLEKTQVANELGLLTLSNGNYRSAMQIFGQVNDTLAAPSYATDRDMQMERVRTLNYMGSSAPIDPAQSMLRDRNDESAVNPINRRRGFRSRISRSFRQMGNENLEYINSAIALVNELVDTGETTPELLLERAKSYLRLAELQYWLKRKSESMSSKTMAVDDLSQLTNLLPDSPQYRSVLAQAYAMPIGQDDESSLLELQKALAITADLVESFPSNANYRQLDAEVNYQLGQLRKDLGQPEEAVEHFEEALTDLRLVWRQVPRNQLIAARLNELAIEQAELLMALGREQESVRLLVRNLRSMRGPQRAPNRNGAARLSIAKQYQLLARIYEEQGKPGEARAAARQARELREKPAPRNPGDASSEKRPGRNRKAGRSPESSRDIENKP